MSRHNAVTKAVDQATDSTWFERLARAGHVVSGLLHLLIAYIVLRLAFGDPGTADQSGALAIFADNAGGRAALWVATVAFVALALWRIAEAIVGPHATEAGEDNSGAEAWLDRGKAFATAIVYVAFAWSAARFAMGDGQSSGSQNAGLSARLMQSTGGKTLLVVAGLVIVGVGAYHVYKGVTRKFLDDLRNARGTAVTVAGVAGYAGKGAVLVATGILVVVAAVKADPSKATGLDGAVKTLAGLPAGQILLVLAAIGLAAYGVYCFWMARFARM
ncbi:DUF1206 domain-containing protein [Gordonia soli]|uniref:DUF1206 domain-containing protein n=1 Tax=Gordonia soli NBRC 108243 TaxID=1223545 RepID=M0QEK2_9ACTN|nr:DUF1206 domain-containing protein [Gordonia soli]GAC66756.1 hypothetical protein GS4_04_00130 [Gordonia soli NBRC 108243]